MSVGGPLNIDFSGDIRCLGDGKALIVTLDHRIDAGQRLQHQPEDYAGEDRKELPGVLRQACGRRQQREDDREGDWRDGFPWDLHAALPSTGCST
jgi:hypothetical protein